jgi:hypothetical protein
MGRNRGTSKAQTVAPTQREVLRDVMLAAGKYAAWMTLRELGRLTRYGETNISAQLRHLRKANSGGAAGKSCCAAECSRRGNIFAMRHKALIPWT